MLNLKPAVASPVSAQGLDAQVCWSASLCGLLCVVHMMQRLACECPLRLTAWLRCKSPYRCVLFLCLFCGLNSAHLANAEALRSVESFLNEAFASQGQEHSALTAAKQETIWLNKDLKAQIARELHYRAPQLRLRYWGRDNRTAWVLEEIGKEQPITMGVVVHNGKIALLDILVYRESRGGEVQYDFFKNQFKGASIVRKGAKPSLDHDIDGITGATMSVRAVKKVALLALFLHTLTPYHRSDDSPHSVSLDGEGTSY